MTTYSIYFENKSGTTQNYGFFCKEPEYTSSVGKKDVYSNVMLSQSVAHDGNWTIDLTTNYYAWCGKAPETVKEGIVVTTGNGKLVRLGTQDAPGSAWEMYNNGGNPAFVGSPTYTARVGAFEIDTRSDFTATQNFILGLGSVDGNGRMKPAAIMPASPNAVFQIQPITQFYLATYDSSVGTTVRTTSYSKISAFINFTDADGQTACTVIQDTKNAWSVRYYSNANFVAEVNRLKAANASSQVATKDLDPGNILADVTLIKRQVESLFDMLKGVRQNYYVGTIQFFDTLGPPNNRMITDRMNDFLTKINPPYVVQHDVYDPTTKNLSIYFTGNQGYAQAKIDWNNAWDSINPDVKYGWNNKGVGQQLMEDRKAIARKILTEQGFNSYNNEITA